MKLRTKSLCGKNKNKTIQKMTQKAFLLLEPQRNDRICGHFTASSNFAHENECNLLDGLRTAVFGEECGRRGGVRKSNRDITH